MASRNQTPQPPRVSAARAGLPLDLLSVVQRAGITPGQSAAGLTVEQLVLLLSAIWRRGNLVTKPFMANLAPQMLLPAEARSYLFIQNQSGAQQIFANFGRPPVATTPIDGVILGANLGAYEPICVSQDAIYVSASANATPGIAVYAR